MKNLLIIFFFVITGCGESNAVQYDKHQWNAYRENAKQAIYSGFEKAKLCLKGSSGREIVLESMRPNGSVYSNITFNGDKYKSKLQELHALQMSCANNAISYMNKQIGSINSNPMTCRNLQLTFIKFGGLWSKNLISTLTLKGQDSVPSVSQKYVGFNNFSYDALAEVLISSWDC
jgi:hypothetical protein